MNAWMAVYGLEREMLVLRPDMYPECIKMDVYKYKALSLVACYLSTAAQTEE